MPLLPPLDVHLYKSSGKDVGEGEYSPSSLPEDEQEDACTF